MLGRNPKLLGSHLLGNGPELGLGLTLSGPKLLRLSKLLGWPLELGKLLGRPLLASQLRGEALGEGSEGNWAGRLLLLLLLGNGLESKLDLRGRGSRSGWGGSRSSSWLGSGLDCDWGWLRESRNCRWLREAGLLGGGLHSTGGSWSGSGGLAKVKGARGDGDWPGGGGLSCGYGPGTNDLEWLEEKGIAALRGSSWPGRLDGSRRG